MSRAVEFRRVLDRLYEKRTHDLRYVLDGYPRGARPIFDRRTVNAGIDELQHLASDHFARKFARREFDASVHQQKSWHAKRGKGWGIHEKRETFKDWYQAHFGSASCIYVFWTGHTCEYVGKTGKGGSRPSSHFEKYWFAPVTRIDVYATRGKRALPALECLGIHHFQPRRNKSKAETRKWLKRCPLCAAHKAIENELRSLFRLRG